MADIWMDVDAALAEVPVNLLPLLDDTDFKTRETAIAYDAAGMDLVWNFVTSAGAFTQTAVTPTTAGAYDWTHQGDGIYTIEIPASGGASINNDTEGYGWFSGFVTGVLPWRGPVIGFRAAAINDSLCDTNTTGILAPTTAGRTLDVSAGGEAGIDWANIGSPTTAVNLSATNIDVDQVVASVSGAVGSVTGAVGSVTGAVGSIAAGGISEASFATTTGSFAPLGISRQGTAQSATGTTLVLDASAPFADNSCIGSTIEVLGSTQGYWQYVEITDYDNATDTVTVEGWPGATPSGTITFKVRGVPPATAAGNAAVADSVWDELLSGHAVSGSSGEALSAAGTAGDPWVTALPGAYGAGTAGKIIGDNINATISSRASQTSVDDVPTNAELATALGTADDAVLAILGTPAGASVSADIAAAKVDTAAIKTKTDFLPSATAGAAGGLFIAGANAATSITTALTANVIGNVTGNLSGSVGSVTGAVGSVTGAVGSVTGAVGSVTGLTAADVGAIKAKTDSLTFTTAGMVDSAVKRVGSTTLSLAGTGGQGYGG